MSQAIPVSEERWNIFVNEVVKRTGIMDLEFSDALIEALIETSALSFIDQKYHEAVLGDVAVPIGYNKVELPLSAIVRMLGLIAPSKGSRVLIAGCGSGFVPALCVQLGAQTYVVESNGLLAQRVRRKLDSSGFQNVLIRTGNALMGWEEYSPFEQIFVSSLLSSYPQVLSRQLVAEDGKLSCIVGAHPESTLYLGERHGMELRTYRLERVRFR